MSDKSNGTCNGTCPDGTPTATDVLRRLLDERGVEWTPSVWSASDETFYKVGEVGYLATELSSERMKVRIDGYPTPEQVVEATLGRGTCKASKQRSMDGKVRGWQCHGCGAAIVTAPSGEEWPELPNYCPECGRSVTV